MKETITAASQLANTKIRVNTPAESKRVQELAQQHDLFARVVVNKTGWFIYTMWNGILLTDPEPDLDRYSFRMVKYSDLFPEPTPTFKKGDRVKMVNCMEATHYTNDVWECRNDSFIPEKGDKEETVFLKDFAGSFRCQFLQATDKPVTDRVKASPEPTRERGEGSPCANNWVSVETRVPEDGENVLAFIDFGDNTKIESYVWDRWAKMNCVTHWQPLPSAPVSDTSVVNTPEPQPITPETLQAEGWDVQRTFDNSVITATKGSLCVEFIADPKTVTVHIISTDEESGYCCVAKGINGYADLKALERLVNGGAIGRVSP